MFSTCGNSDYLTSKFRHPPINPNIVPGFTQKGIGSSNLYNFATFSQVKTSKNLIINLTPHLLRKPLPASERSKLLSKKENC